MLLRGQTCEPELQPLCDWWTEFQIASDKQKKIMCQALQQARQGNRPGRNKKKKSRKKSASQNPIDADREPNSNV
jgi:hypothetical protein